MRRILKIVIAVLIVAGLGITGITGITSANECVKCHRYIVNYTAEEMKFNEIRMRHISRGISCSLECHADEFRGLASSAYIQWSESKHGLNGITCEKCHGGNASAYYKEDAHEGIIPPTDPSSPLYYTKVPELCGQCHRSELEAFKQSRHYVLLETLHQAPSCTTCHPPHKYDVRKPEEFVRFCGACHAEDGGVAPLNIPYESERVIERTILLKESLDLLEKRTREAKAQGYDVSATLSKIKAAEAELERIPEKWHSFDITGLKTSIDSVEMKYSEAKKELQEILSPKVEKKEVKETPGFTTILAISAIISAIVLARRLR
jgi:hypothetical protein